MKTLPLLDECVCAYNTAFRNPLDAEQTISALTSSPPFEVIQARLGELLPHSMIAVIGKYDFSSLSVGQVIFEYGLNYMRLVEINRPGLSAWWRGEVRPAGRLLMGETTGWRILIACDSDHVLAYEGSCSGPETASRIAPNFDVFFRLSCMIAADASWLVESTQMPGIGPFGARFWDMLARGVA